MNMRGAGEPIFEIDFPPGSDILGEIREGPKAAERMEFELFNRFAVSIYWHYDSEISDANRKWAPAAQYSLVAIRRLLLFRNLLLGTALITGGLVGFCVFYYYLL